MSVRPLAPDDLPALRGVIATLDLFPADMLDAMAAPALEAGPREGPIWRVAPAQAPAALAFAEPEAMTDGTWNLRLIAVAPEAQGEGLGRALMAAVEAEIVARGGHLVVVDTSATQAFDGARRFYERLGYAQVATIPDFWGLGDGKVTLTRRL